MYVYMQGAGGDTRGGVIPFGGGGLPAAGRDHI